ncbi:MAG: IS4 family transposase [Chloroflexi bacterium]|nr:IS4 family transposase [Chloroflexota bacterium]
MSFNQTYHTWMQRIRQLRPNERNTRVRNMAQLLSGIVESQSVHLSKVANPIVSTATLPSVTRRLSRFLDNSAVRVRDWYEPIARDLLQSAAQTVGEIRLMADASQVGFQHQLLVIALAYRRRAIPLVWTWIRSNRGHSSARTQLALMAYVQRMLPSGVPVLLVGDSEFGAIPVMQQVEQWGWYYVLRQKSNHQMQLDEQADWRDCGQLVTHAGPCVWLSEVQLTRKYAQPTNLLAYWRPREVEPWLLATNLPDPTTTVRVYGRRMWIEELFGDLKGHGFHLADTHLQHVARLSRLTLAVVLLYTWLVSVGTRVIKNGQRSLVDRADRRDLSIFQIGWRWIQRRLAQMRAIPIPLCPTNVSQTVR